jgi:NAD+ kinase
MSDAPGRVETVAYRGNGGELERALSAVGRLADLPDADLVVADGEAALLEVARELPAVPVYPAGVDGLPVDGAGRGDADDRDPSAAVDALFAGEWTTAPYGVAAVTVGDERVSRALMDVMLVTEEPATIAEYGVTLGDRRLGTLRADGVVAATPAGSVGYAGAAGGPNLSPGTGLAVVPVSPFVTDSRSRVCTWAEGVTFTVERDCECLLVVDGRELRAVPPGEPVTVERDGTVELVRPAGG